MKMKIAVEILMAIRDMSIVPMIQLFGWIPFAIAAAIASVGYALIRNVRNKRGGDRP